MQTLGSVLLPKIVILILLIIAFMKSCSAMLLKDFDNYLELSSTNAVHPISLLFQRS